MRQRIKSASDIKAGDRIPSNEGTYTVNQVEKRGSKILAFTDEKLPDDTYCIQFGWTEIVAVNEPDAALYRCDTCGCEGKLPGHYDYNCPGHIVAVDEPES